MIQNTKVIVLGLLICLLTAAAFADEPKMKAHFISVGQADSTLLEFPCGAVLIDAGAQDDVYTQKLTNYLRNFFNERQDLHKTLDSVIITHNHIDHTKALRAVAEHFHIRHYIDNGQLTGRGTENPKWMRAHTAAGTISEILDKNVPTDGLTNGEIDPVSCASCDPRIIVLSGQKGESIGWSEEDFDNKNNHSITIRVEFGESSFLFTGDLEEAGIDALLSRYPNSPLLDADVYHVGHHGSYNATTEELLAAVTPKLAVVSMGEWTFGQNSRDRFTTWAYGHPRKAVIDLLSQKITSKRSAKVTAAVATAAKKFQPMTVTRSIYGTGWEGNITLTADLHGKMRVTTEGLPITPPLMMTRSSSTGAELLRTSLR